MQERKVQPMSRKWAITLAAALLMSVTGKSASGTGPKDLPKPTDYVSDFAKVLSPAAVKDIDHICNELEHSNASTQLAVVTIPSIDGADIAEYASELANLWGIGGNSSNHGVLVLLAIKDHKWRIAVSRGLEATLTDAEALSIGQKMIPLLRANDFHGALKLAVNQIAQAVSPE
jgi:uncharacterized protein